VAATKPEGSALAALMRAAMALPILVVPARAGAAEVGEVGITILGYKERGLMKVSEPVIWGQARFGEWEFQASGAVDIVTGASPQVVSNESGQPVQSITGASISDRRTTGDIKITRTIGDLSLAASRTVSNEEDYNSRAFGLEARFDLNQRNTTLVAGYGKSNDRVRSADDPTLNEPRVTLEYLLGVTQILSPLAAVQSTITVSHGRGWYNDPYKLTLTFYPDAPPAVANDRRPSSRDSVAWLTRYRQHLPGTSSTLQADYRYFQDDWGIRSHTLEVAWQRDLGERWAIRPALRYYTQSAADFYTPLIPRPQPAAISSDQRLSSFGGLSPSLRLIVRLAGGLRVEGTAGYVYNSASLRLGGSGSEAFQTLRAYYGIIGISREF
jgi:hypothetical protein